MDSLKFGNLFGFIYSALIYDDKNLDKVVDFKPYSSRLYELWNQSSKGLHGEIAEVAKKLAHMALEGFDRLPPCLRMESLGKFLVYLLITLP